MSLHRGERGEAVEQQEARRHRDDVGEHDGPDEREGHRQVLGEHVRPGNQAKEEEAAEQDRHRGAARHAEGDGRNQRAAFLGVARRARPDHAAYIALAEAFALLRRARTLRGVAVGHPLRHRAAEPRGDADESADQAAADRQPEMAEHVLHARERAAADASGRRVARDRGAAYHQVDDLRNGE